MTITGRKKEIIVTAGGKNVAPAVLEDQLRAHPLISQAMVVGDAKPFIGALITIDPEAFEGWKQRNGKAAGASVGDLANDPDLLAEVDAAVKQANLAVSHAESIRKFRILPVDFTEDTGELTPTMKVKRKVVAEKFADDIEAIYTQGASRVIRSASRAARSSHRHCAVTHSRPAAPIAAARSGSASSSLTASAICVHRTAVDHQPSLVVPHGFRRTARGSGDHRHAGRRRLQEDDAQPLDVQSGAAGAARHGEHVGHRVVGGQFGGRNAAGERDVFADAEALGQSRAALSRYGPPPTMTSAAPSTRCRIDGSARISMSWPLRGTSRDRHTTVGRWPRP